MIYGMAPAVSNDPEELDLLRRAGQGDEPSLQELFARYRGRLRRMVRLRLDSRVEGRVDPSDVIREAYLESFKGLPEYLRDPPLPFFLWLRSLTGEKLARAHGQHLGAQARDAGGEVSLYRGALPEASSAALAAQLMGRLPTASEAVARAGLKVRIQESLNGMDPLDREVLTLRHFEQLSNAETALVLGLKESAACNRYVRALERLHGILSNRLGPSGPRP
jgi:RNA polymerase sigma-70 factor (ECF subfamily)